MQLATIDERDRYRVGVDSIDDLHPWHFVRAHTPPGSSVLDVGCGSGDLARWIGDLPGYIDGVEPNIERARLASDRLRSVAVGDAGPGIESHLSSPYDRVLLTDVVEHVADPRPLVQWATEQLHPDGLLLALIPNSATWKVRRKLLRGDWSYASTGYFDRDHLRFYDTRTARYIGTELGLAEVAVEFAPARLPRPLHRSARAARWVARVRPNLFSSYTCLAWGKPQGH